MLISSLMGLSLFLIVSPPAGGGPALEISVYATAGDVQRHLATPASREKVAGILQPLGVSRLFLEGRRGDEYVQTESLRAVRDFFRSRGLRCAGGIATVPGRTFGVRQNGGLSWLNWESAKTQRDVSGFFSENAPIFDELIVDDFYCTGDTSPESDRARAGREWGEYRRELLVSLIDPVIVQPSRNAQPGIRLILKYPQWYDRFHKFGYDPPRMSGRFDQIWVGTEVRDPKTRRMGFVQPTEGYVNFRWLASVAGEKVRGAWFDHIECSAQHFIDQAYQSVLAGARELTLFHLGDLVEGHAGDALLAARLPGLFELAGKVRGQQIDGIAFYKPANSEPHDNQYLMDYLAMMGLPVVPVARYPETTRMAFLAAQAAADPNMLDKMRRHLERGGTLVLTPAFVRALGQSAGKIAGMEVGSTSVPADATTVQTGSGLFTLPTPIQLDASLATNGAQVLIGSRVDGQPVPWLTVNASGQGHVHVLNVRTFSEQDFLDAGERLLAPKPLGLAEIPEKLADELRATLLAPIEVRFNAPTGVALYLFGRARCVYSFRDEPVTAQLDGETIEIAAHGWVWRERR
ncbi:MAG: hypothetical protein HY735_01630 [Verrucomicrobia bacterium]|nr:hypothetical protein [Verrucomicrobiota bacterium]